MKKRAIRKFLIMLVNSFSCVLFFFSIRRCFFKLLGFSVGRNASVFSNVTFFDFGKFSIGENSTLNKYCFIDNRAGVYIGDNVNISHCCKIYSLGHDVNDPLACTIGKEVIIKNNSWIFPNVIIMPGVVIGEGSVVYPGAVVTKDVEDYSVVGGNPAVYIKKRNENIKYTLDNNVWFSL